MPVHDFDPTERTRPTLLFRIVFCVIGVVLVCGCAGVFREQILDLLAYLLWW